MLRWVVACAFVALAVQIAAAHDYWLAQEPRTLRPGDDCMIRLWVGDELVAEVERPLQHESTTRYEWLSGSESVDLLASMPDSTQPVFHRRLTEPGTSLFVMDRKFHPIKSTVGGFLQFLEHEERPDLAARFADTSPDQPLHRRYARNLKALVRVAESEISELHAQRVGQALEIRLMNDPHGLESGAELPVHVEFEGANVPNQLVKGFVEGNDGTVSVVKGTTDEQGIVRFPLDRAGLWVIRTTYLRESKESDMDWDTYYATFSFVYP